MITKLITSFMMSLSVLVSLILAQTKEPQMILVPSGSFEMGDHSGLGGEDPKHPSDERPLHTVSITGFYMGKYHITNDQFCTFLNDAYSSNKLTITNGYVFWKGVSDTLFRTKEATQYSQIDFNRVVFTVRNKRGDHPVTDVRWAGTAAYCNWLSLKKGLTESYDLASGNCTFTGNGYRLPTEAEWEYAAYGGRTDYPIFPWGSDTASSLYGLYANWENSKDPFEGNDTPFTTPAGFYDGQTKSKEICGWAGNALTYTTRNNVNGFGLYDMSGNVWQLCNDWYSNPYYSKSPAVNPPGPIKEDASLMPDGKPFRCMRGGSWFNGATMYGHGRISNRNPSYFRGPGDPNGPWFHIGFRVVMKYDSLKTSIKEGFESKENAITLKNINPKQLNQLLMAVINTNTIIQLCDLQGKVIRSYQSNSKGVQNFEWDFCSSYSKQLSNGCYLIKLKSSGHCSIHKIILRD